MQLKGRQLAIIILALATALLHFGAAFDKRIFPDMPDPLFTLNGLGYLGLLGAYFLPIPFAQKQHKLAWRVFFIYTIVTIVAWFLIYVLKFVIIDGHPFFSVDAMYGIPAKIVEFVLLYFLRKDKP
ncbi:MAG TPA: hypothetical protein VIU38_13850 [Anaerolineales bacterium]